MHGADAAAGAADLSMFVTASHNDPERDMAVIETFHQAAPRQALVTLFDNPGSPLYPFNRSASSSWWRCWTCYASIWAKGAD